MLTEQENLILNESLSYLDAFIQDSGCFYPFAMIMDKRGDIFSIDPNIDDEFPDSETVIQTIEEYINDEYKQQNSNYTLTIICIDVFIHETINGEQTKRNAIEIRLISPESKKVYHLGYGITEDNKLVIGDFINNKEN